VIPDNEALEGSARMLERLLREQGLHLDQVYSTNPNKRVEKARSRGSDFVIYLRDAPLPGSEARAKVNGFITVGGKESQIARAVMVGEDLAELALNLAQYMRGSFELLHPLAAKNDSVDA